MGRTRAAQRARQLPSPFLRLSSKGLAAGATDYREAPPDPLAPPVPELPALLPEVPLLADPAELPEVPLLPPP
jgi:hypothetical protein